MAQSPHADLAELPDFPAQRAARLIADAARDAARAWVQVPDADALNVTWGLHKALGDIGITLWRLTRFRYQAESAPDAEDTAPTRLRHVWMRGRDGLLSIPDDPRDPDLLIHRSGFAAVRAGRSVFGLDVLSHVHRQIARGLPVGGDPQTASPAVSAAHSLAAASASARKIMISAEPGARFTARHVAARDWAVLTIADAIDRLDETTTHAVSTPGPLKNRLAPLHAELPDIGHTLRLAVTCSAARTGGGNVARLAAIAFPRSPAEAASSAALTQPVTSTAPRPSPGHTARTPGRRTAP